MENNYITVHYKLYSIDENGERNFEEATSNGKPFRFISGIGMALDAFEAAIIPLKPDEQFDFTLKAADAYGEYDDEHVIDLPKNIFFIDGKFDSERITPNAIVPLMTNEGQRINAIVVEVKDDVVVVDLNHPLAGCDLNFVGKVVENRPATAQEMAAAAQMMSGECGGCGGNCGGGCEGGCGGGCEGGCGGGCGK